MRDMKTITFSKRSRARVLHIEAPGCIVNIRHALRDTEGREVTSVQINADQTQESSWTLPDMFDLRDVAEIIVTSYKLFHTMTHEEIEEHIREKLRPATSYNVRVRRYYNANENRDLANQ